MTVGLQGGTKYIYLDLYSKTYWIKFKCENGGKFTILKDNREKLKDYKQVSIAETIERERDRLEQYYEFCVQRLADFIIKHPDNPYVISHSGGKDSELTYQIWKEMLNRINFVPQHEFVFFNTTNETADVYKDIMAKGDIRIINPEKPWRKWIEEHGWMLPTVFRRSCCSTYKEGQSKKEFDNSKPYIQVLGIRCTESNKRANYEFFMNYEFDKSVMGGANIPKLWSKLAPIVECETVDVWLIILIKGFHVNRRYKLGSMRVGCVICPYSSSYDDEITKKYYKEQWRWFTEAAEKNYYYYYYSAGLGWTKEEWLDGAWKKCAPKSYALLHRSATKENISQYAKMKGISDDIAKKYFGATCAVCGTQCNEREVGMFLKTFGRYENQEDNRKPLCRKHFCEALGIEKKDFYKKVVEYTEEGCPLF